jgi:transcriptional regulator with XRE-family HTH domain
MRGILHDNSPTPSVQNEPEANSPGSPPNRRPPHCFQSPLDDRDIVEALRVALPQDWSHARIARKTGFHSETVRRYMNGTSRVPAAFIAACCRAYGLDAAAILMPEAHADTCMVRLSHSRLQATAETIGRQAIRTLLGPAGRQVLANTFDTASENNFHGPTD